MSLRTFLSGNTPTQACLLQELASEVVSAANLSLSPQCAYKENVAARSVWPLGQGQVVQDNHDKHQAYGKVVLGVAFLGKPYNPLHLSFLGRFIFTHLFVGVVLVCWCSADTS